MCARAASRWPGQQPTGGRNDGVVDMEVDAVYKGKGKGGGGKAKGKGTDQVTKKGSWAKGTGGKEQKGLTGRGGGKGASGKTLGDNECRVCGRQGHWGNECWYRPQKGGGKGKGAKGKGKAVQEVQLGENEKETAETMSVREKGAENMYDPTWCLGVQGGGREPRTDGRLRLVVDSGSAIHVCPTSVAPWLVPLKGRSLQILSAGGQPLRHHGQRKIRIRLGEQVARILFEVAEVQRPLLSVARLAEEGWKTSFGLDDVELEAPDKTYRIRGRKENGLYIIEGVVMEDPGGGMATGHQRLRKERKEVAPLEVEGEEGEGGARRRQEAEQAQGVRVPERKADSQSREAHDLTHVPFQDWCAACVAARARDDPHRARPRQPEGSLPLDEWPVAELDYSFGKTEDGGQEVKMLHAFVRGIGFGGTTVAEKKGGGDAFAVAWAARHLELAGLGDVVLQVDGEPATVALAKEVQKRRAQGGYRVAVSKVRFATRPCKNLFFFLKKCVGMFRCWKGKH